MVRMSRGRVAAVIAAAAALLTAGATGDSLYWGSGYCGTACFTAPANNDKLYVRPPMTIGR